MTPDDTMRRSRRTFLRAAGATAAALMAGPMLFAQASGDPRGDPAYLDRRIKHISDADLFDALDLSRPGLGDLRAAAEKKDWPAAYKAWATYWPTVASRVRFSGEAESLVSREVATQWAAADRTKILADADQLLNHEFKGWGDVTAKFGPVVDFNYDFGQSGKYGFHYWFWAWPLVRAFLLTNDQKYLAGFERLFNQWYEQRDKITGGFPGLDVVYYELGLGARNRIFLEFYGLPQPERAIQTHARMLKTLLGAARWLADEEAIGYRSGNWQVIGSFGMAQIGLMAPEFKESRAWVELGSQRTLEHLESDFFSDGCHSERCPSSYMGNVYRVPQNLARLLADDPSQHALAEKLRKPLERSLNFWLGILPPDGVLPGINDGSRSRMSESVLQDGFELFGRRDLLWAKGHLLGVETKEKGVEPTFTSIHFPVSGFTAMRSGWSKDATYLLINHGPYGDGHSHADSLSFELNAFGTAMAIDSGLGLTYDEPEYLTWYKKSVAHNMLTVDGEDLDRTVAEGKDVAWQSNAALDHFAATHHGYEASKGIIHRRQIVFLKPNYFVVFDRVDATAAKGKHSLEWNAHLTVPVDAGPALIVQPADSWTASKDKAIASVLGVRGFDQPYAKIEWLKFKTSIDAGAKLSQAVLLYPFVSAPPKVRIERLGDEQFVVHQLGREDEISFGHDAVEIKTKHA